MDFKYKSKVNEEAIPHQHHGYTTLRNVQFLLNAVAELQEKVDQLSKEVDAQISDFDHYVDAIDKKLKEKVKAK